jgi:hypothetical protein
VGEEVILCRASAENVLKIGSLKCLKGSDNERQRKRWLRKECGVQ